MDEKKEKPDFSQETFPVMEKTLEDFFSIKGGVLNLLGILQTANFIPGVRGVRIRNEGLNASGAEIQGTLDGQVNPTNALTVSQGGTGATTLTGILKGNGTGAITAITPLAGTKVYYVSDTSGGVVNRKLTFQDGILVSET